MPVPVVCLLCGGHKGSGGEVCNRPKWESDALVLKLASKYTSAPMYVARMGLRALEVVSS